MRKVVAFRRQQGWLALSSGMIKTKWQRQVQDDKQQLHRVASATSPVACDRESGNQTGHILFPRCMPRPGQLRGGERPTLALSLPLWHDPGQAFRRSGYLAR